MLQDVNMPFVSVEMDTTQTHVANVTPSLQHVKRLHVYRSHGHVTKNTASSDLDMHIVCLS